MLNRGKEILAEKQVETSEAKIEAQASETVAMEPGSKYENNTLPQNISKGDLASGDDNVKMDSKQMDIVDSIQRKNSVRQKKQSRQQSEIPDSEEVPDIETFNDEKAAGLEADELNPENKDLLSNVDDLDLDDEPEFRRSRRASSYEETLANMDPELLAELGLSPTTGG